MSLSIDNDNAVVPNLFVITYLQTEKQKLAYPLGVSIKRGCCLLIDISGIPLKISYVSVSVPKVMDFNHFNQFQSKGNNFNLFRSSKYFGLWSEKSVNSIAHKNWSGYQTEAAGRHMIYSVFCSFPGFHHNHFFLCRRMLL